MSEVIKEPIYQIIGNFLKSQINIPFTIPDLIRNLTDSKGDKLKDSTISSSLTYLSKGRKIKKKGKFILTKTGKHKRQFYKGFGKGKIRNISKGQWIYYKKVDYESWTVDFKLRDTKSTRKPKNSWNKKIMDLTGSATGIAPSKTSKSQIINISALKLFHESLDIMSDNGVILWGNVDETDSQIVVFGARKNENQTLETYYDDTWEGKLHFTNNVGTSYQYKVSYKVRENEYD